MTSPDRAVRRGRFDPSPERIGFGPRFVTAVSLGSVLNPINSSIIAIALVSIGQAFSVGTDTTAWLVSGLYLATAIGQPTMGKLADRLGPRRIYLVGLALVAIGGVLGFLGNSIWLLVVARVVIGVGTSAAYPAAMAMVRRQSARLDRPTPGGVLGALAIAGQASMAIGPPLGGLLIAVGGWPWTFLVNLPLALVGLVFALLWLPRDEPGFDHGQGAAWHALDPPGLALFTAAMSTLLIFLMSPAVADLYLLGIAVVLLVVLVWWELRARLPFIDVRMLARNRPLSVTYLRYAVTLLVTYGFIYGWTQWLEQAAGQTAAVTGGVLTAMFVVAVPLSALGSRGRKVLGPLVIGTVALVVGSCWLLLFDAHTPIWAFVGVSAVFGVSNGLNIVGNQAAMYGQAPADQIGTAAGLLRTSQYLGAILSTSLISISYGQRATDAGLHTLAAVLAAASALLLVATVFDRGLRRDGTA
jgi:MFS family permease